MSALYKLLSQRVCMCIATKSQEWAQSTKLLKRSKLLQRQMVCCVYDTEISLNGVGTNQTRYMQSTSPFNSVYCDRIATPMAVAFRFFPPAISMTNTETKPPLAAGFAYKQFNLTLPVIDTQYRRSGYHLTTFRPRSTLTNGWNYRDCRGGAPFLSTNDKMSWSICY